MALPNGGEKSPNKPCITTKKSSSVRNRLDLIELLVKFIEPPKQLRRWPRLLVGLHELMVDNSYMCH